MSEPISDDEIKRLTAEVAKAEAEIALNVKIAVESTSKLAKAVAGLREAKERLVTFVNSEPTDQHPLGDPQPIADAYTALDRTLEEIGE